MSGSLSGITVVILAAGLGTRMKSNKAKVLHALLGRPMISYVVETAQSVAGNNLVLVIGHQADEVRQTVAAQAEVRFALQEEQLGTGHAVMCAMPHIPMETRHVVVLCGDVPLLGRETLQQFVLDHCSGERTLSILAVHLDDPTGYGRIVRDGQGGITGIVEEADATALQKAINLVNTGIYCVEKGFLEVALQQIQADNAQGEYYLTDIVTMAYKANRSIGMTVGPDHNEFVGINSREQLAAVERMMHDRQS